MSHNLDRLIEALEKLVEDDPELRERRNTAKDLAAKIADGLPLAHSTGRGSLRKILREDRLLSLEQLSARSLLDQAEHEARPVEEILETADSVFTYAGHFGYPSTSCGLLFQSAVETRAKKPAVATPFDSGGVVAHLRPNDSEADQIRFVREHELPVPGYRKYLAGVLATLFCSPWDYVDGRDPDRLGPVETYGGDRRRWLFEVRFKDELSLTGTLLAVFLPIDVAVDESMLDRISTWKLEGVRVIYYRTPRDGNWARLHELGVEFSREYLGDEDA